MLFSIGTESEPEVRLACWGLDDPLWTEEIHLVLQACNLNYYLRLFRRAEFETGNVPDYVQQLVSKRLT